MRQDNPSFDDVEVPEVVVTRIDGMSDEQWAARNDRQGRRLALAFGVLGWIASLAVEWLWWSGVFRAPWAMNLNLWAMLALSAVAFIVAFVLGLALIRWR